MSNQEYIPPTGLGVTPLQPKRKHSFAEILGQHIEEDDDIDEDILEDPHIQIGTIPL